MEEVAVHLGKNLGSGEEVYWKPKAEKNPHFLVVGTSGSGKTETLRAIVHEFSKIKIPVMIIDFHRDFEDIAENVMDFNNVTINPLEYCPETPEMAMYKVSHILKKIFNLGVQQEGILQDAIHEAYRNRGIGLKATEPNNDTPTFDDVRDILESKLDQAKEEKRSTQTIETLLVRLRPLFNTGFFTKKNSMNFREIFHDTTVLKLRDMPTDEVKYAVAEFFINKLKYELYSRGKTSKIVLYCVIDEAHRLLDERSPLNDLLRESRKYGTGVILSSQRPSDFSDTVLANIGGIISFQCRLDKDAIFVGRQMSMNFEDIKNLTETGVGYASFSSRQDAYKLKVKPLWEREKGVKKKPKKKEEAKEESREEKKAGAKEENKPELQKSRTIKKAGTLGALEEETKSDAELTSDKIYLDAQRFYFPLFNWLTRGFRRFFSDARLAAAFSVAMALAITLFANYSPLVLLAFVLIFVMMGMKK